MRNTYLIQDFRKPYRIARIGSTSIAGSHAENAFSLAIAIVLMPQLLSAGSVYDYHLTTIDYQRIHLRDFKSKVLMIVNVASRCGYTLQYAGLQNLYLAHKDQGFVVIGIPSDDFGQGEPGSNPEIKQFCTQIRRYVPDDVQSIHQG